MQKALNLIFNRAAFNRDTNSAFVAQLSVVVSWVILEEKMNQQELIEELNTRVDVPKYVIEKLLNEFKSIVRERVAEGEDVKLHSLGTFFKKTCQARNGHHPQTFEAIQIPERQIIGFRRSRFLDIEGA